MPNDGSDVISHETFYQRLDRVERENRIKRVFKDRPENLHDYQGCAKDAAESLPAAAEQKCECGHGREHHALRDGVHGSGFCTYDKAGEMQCQCQSFEMPVVEPKPTPSIALRAYEVGPSYWSDRIAHFEKVYKCGSASFMEAYKAGLLSPDNLDFDEWSSIYDLKPQPDSSSIPADQIVDANKMVDSSSISTELSKIAHTHYMKHFLGRDATTHDLENSVHVEVLAEEFSKILVAAKGQSNDHIVNAHEMVEMIDKTLSCTSGMSHPECLMWLMVKLGAK